MALVVGSLHDWMIQSAYVWGRDQTAAVVGRKKSRAHRKGAAGGDDRGQTSDRAVRDSFGKISNRRYRRWMNDQLLRDLVPPMEAAEIESLFAPPPWGEQRVVTPLEQVTGGGARGAIDMARWEPFRNVDMDAQAKWIQHAEESRSAKESCSPGKQVSAMEAWRGVERTARGALRRNSQSPLLQTFEEKVLEYLSEVEGRGVDKELALEAETSHHRLLLHGLTQFHGLKSRTVAIVPDASHVEGKASLVAQSLIMIRKRGSNKAENERRTQSPERSLNLIDFLRRVQHHSPVAVVA